MWGSRGRGHDRVTCVACGETVSRSGAREYDKHGDRWDRADKEFEHLCKTCHRNLCHQPRDELESLLVDIESPGLTQEEFLARYLSAVERRYGPADPDDR
ncbi:MAG: hypothetical protein ABEJ06_04885 [Haloarculaceae archaeon]